MFAVLRQRNFTLPWFGQLASLLGDWVLFVALPFFVYDLTGSTLATGAMFIALTLPRLLLGSVAGVFGAFAAISALAQLLGMAFASILGDQLGVVPILSLDGVLYCCAGLLALLALRGAVVQPAPQTLDGSRALG